MHDASAAARAAHTHLPTSCCCHPRWRLWHLRLLARTHCCRPRVIQTLRLSIAVMVLC
jgi:hypothetical protein